MEKIRLVVPRIEDKLKALDYVKECFESGEESLNGSGGLDSAESFESWLETVKNNREGRQKEGLVPATTYFAIRESDNKILGMIDIRHYLNEWMIKNACGHIGYEIRPSERRKGYATEMLKLGLIECRNKNINLVEVSCDSTNIGSRKTILNNNGVLDRVEFESSLGDEIEVYKIKVR